MKLSNRRELGNLFNELGLLGNGIEVGVYKADHAENLLSIWKGNKLYLVDAWQPIPDKKVNWSDFDEAYQITKNKLGSNPRVKIIKELSADAVKLFPNNFFDFVYIDADHTYDGVMADIESWRHKIKSGGILCGHDYLNGKIGKVMIEVKTAVDNLADKYGWRVYCTEENFPSWFIIL